MKRFKVLHVIGGGEIGGAERHVLTLIKLLDKEIFSPELLCLCRGPFAPLAREQGITTHEIIMRHKLDLSVSRKIEKLLAEKEIALVHTHGARANLVARTAAKNRGLPVVTTFHSVLAYDYPWRHQASTARFLTKLTNRYTDRFIAVSHFVKEDVVRMGVPPGKVEVIYNGLNPEALKPKSPPPEVRKRLGLAPDQRVVGVIGRLHPVKGQEYFVEAARRLAPAWPEAAFLLIGEGPDRDKLSRLVHRYGLEGRVLLPGFYPQAADIYGVMEILCLPSVMEGMPLVLLEAMHFGVPVVASRVGGIPEVIKDGENGILIPPKNPAALAEAIEALLEDEPLRNKLAEQARKSVREMTVEKMAQRTMEVYKSLLIR